MPTMHIPDKLFIEIVKLGKEYKQYVREAVYEKLERDGVEMESKLEIRDEYQCD